MNAAGAANPTLDQPCVDLALKFSKPGLTHTSSSCLINSKGGRLATF
jgi:hypothetical protein